jgi:hypothetical protein
MFSFPIIVEEASQDLQSNKVKYQVKLLIYPENIID